MPFASAPIGIYDSGLGGLSVVKQLQRLLPHESFVYVADAARVPYGGRSEAEIRQFSLEIIEHLSQYQVKAILCACNTSSVVILPELRRYQGIPVLGLAQAGSLAVKGYRRVALLATEATVRSQLYRELIARRFPEVELFDMACPEFVPLVESGQWHGPEVKGIVQRRLQALLDWKADAVILGCSHYPYLANVLGEVLGAHVAFLDPAEFLVKELQQILIQQHLHTPYRQATAQFQTTGQNVQRFSELASAYLGYDINGLTQVELASGKQTERFSEALEYGLNLLL